MSSELAANVAKAAREAFDHWVRANNKAKVYMLAGMSELLRRQHEQMETAYEIMQSLDGMFGQPSEQAHLDAVNAFMNDKMKPGTKVRPHVLKMIDHLHNTELNGAMIDEKTQVSIILQSLPSKFQQFKNNYVMNKVSYNLTQLLNELQAFESVNDTKGGEANVAEASSVKNKKNKRKLAVKNKGKFKKKGKPNQKGNSKRTGNKDKGNCFHCEKPGH